MLDDLIIAMESDLANNGSLVDIGRVSGFMQKVCLALDNIGVVAFLSIIPLMSLLQYWV